MIRCSFLPLFVLLGGTAFAAVKSVHTTERTDVLGGKAGVAMLYRTKPEASALIHDQATEIYYIIEGSGTIVTGGTLKDHKPTDLTRLGAGMSRTGERVGGEGRKVKPKDIIIVPAGTPHSFSQLDGPISYLVYRFWTNTPAK